MKCDRFLTLSLVLSLGLVFPPSLPAQNPPATTFHPGPWQPVARVNMSRPVEIKIINQCYRQFQKLLLKYKTLGIPP